MKNVVKMSYLRRDFIKFENDNDETMYLIYTRQGSITTPSIKTIMMVIDQILAEPKQARRRAA